MVTDSVTYYRRKEAFIKTGNSHKNQITGAKSNTPGGMWSEKEANEYKRKKRKNH